MEIRDVLVSDIKNNKNEVKELIRELIKISRETDIKESTNIVYDNMIKYLTDRTAIMFGAFDNSILIGFIWGYEIKQSIYHINYFCINEEYRGKGIGKALMKKMQDKCIREDAKEIELNVSNNNEGAIRFYQENDFEKSYIKMTKKL